MSIDISDPKDLEVNTPTGLEQVIWVADSGVGPWPLVCITMQGNTYRFSTNGIDAEVAGTSIGLESDREWAEALPLLPTVKWNTNNVGRLVQETLWPGQTVPVTTRFDRPEGPLPVGLNARLLRLRSRGNP